MAEQPQGEERGQAFDFTEEEDAAFDRAMAKLRERGVLPRRRPTEPSKPSEPPVKR